MFEVVTEEEFVEAHEDHSHTFCGTVTLSQEEREWREEHYERADIATFPCDFCGHCPNPGQCVRSVTCPLCFRVAGHGCVRPNDPLVVEPYHEARWQLVKTQFGVYYK